MTDIANKTAITIALALSAGVSVASGIFWLETETVTLDLDCDTVAEQVSLGVTDDQFVIAVTPSTTGQRQKLWFGLAQPDRQDALCTDTPQLSAVKASRESLLEALGAVPEGFIDTGACQSLVISDGACDSINVYYNHHAHVLDWWRF